VYVGSDDAAPPYIPAQFLGSRRDELTRITTGVYSRKDLDALSTIDEQSIKVSGWNVEWMCFLAC